MHIAVDVQTRVRIATRLASDLKGGLISHLKQDVDVELQRKLTPKVVAEAEQKKVAALKKLKKKRVHVSSQHKGDDAKSQVGPRV
jgi:hypothetical protein